ncbi:MAG: OmpA family protein [Bacteroidota bacterium]
MKVFKISLLAVLLFQLPTLLVAQQSSKTKAANKLYEKGGEVEIINTIKINSEGLDFSPAYYQNGIVFASSRYKNGERDKKIGETYFELFYAELDVDGVPMEPRDFSLQVNSHLHEGPVTFNRQGDLMYFTRNHINKGIRKANSKGQTVLKIYEAHKGPSDWKDVKALPFCDDEYNYAHPSLSADGKQLFFASDMPGGFGGMDLYRVERTTEGWSTPINLGAEINTEKSEVFPFIHSSGNLFFASNGWPGVGGLDLFMVDISGRKWGKVTNLGEPFNSNRDDLGLILDPLGKQGYFASARQGGAGKDDIYMFVASDGIWGRTRPSDLQVSLTVEDEQNRQLIAGAQVQIFEKKENGFVDERNEPIYESILLPAAEGSSSKVFRKVLKESDQLQQRSFTTDAAGRMDYTFVGEQQYLIVVSKEGYQRQEWPFTAVAAAGESLRVPLAAERCVELEGMVNTALGEGIAKALVKVKNQRTGEEQLVVADDQGRFTQCLPVGDGYTVTGIKEDFTKQQINISRLSRDSELEKIELTLAKNDGPAPEKPLEKGTIIVLENIYYDFNKSHIRSGDAAELDELLAIMQRYPSMKIELSSHTDSRGGTRYNRRLSIKRAISAMQYLVARGISSNRIKAVGYGEAQLRNHCRDGVDCSEEEHQYNRRTEVRVIELNEDVQVQYRQNSPKIIDRRNR